MPIKNPDIKIFRRYMHEMGDHAGEILYKDQDLLEFIAYVDYACKKKKDMEFPRYLEFKTPDELWDADVEYWLNILFALMERFVTKEMVKNPLKPEFQDIPMTADNY